MKRRAAVENTGRCCALPPRARRGRGQPGFALLLVFLMAALVAIALYRELPRVAFESQRAKEQLLIDRGEQYKRAIQLFVRQNNGRYPMKLEDLESYNNRRYLRRRYKDPMTGSDEWRLVHVGPGGVLTDSKTQKPPRVQGGEFGTPVEEIAEQQQGQQPDPAQTPAPWARLRPSDVRPPVYPGAAVQQPVEGDEQPGQETTPQDPVPYGPPVPGEVPEGDPIAQQPVPGEQAGVVYAPGQGPAGIPFVPGQQAPTGQPPVPGQVVVEQPALPWQRSTSPAITPGQPVVPVPAPYAPQMAPPGTYGASPYPPTMTPNAPPTYAQPGMAIPGDPAAGPNQPFAGIPDPIRGQLFNPRQTGIPGQRGRRVFGSSGGPLAGSPAMAPGQGMFGSRSGQNVPGAAGGIAGVASKLDQKSIKTYEERSKYDEWEFIYDPRKDTTGALGPGMNTPNLQNPPNPAFPRNPAGPNPSMFPRPGSGR